MTAHLRLRAKTQHLINREWDRLAPVRFRQIASNIDTTYLTVLLPTVLRLCRKSATLAAVLDVGCGIGHLTRQLSSIAGRVTGVDPSCASMAFARKVAAGAGNIDFFLGTVEAFSLATDKRFDLAVANMTLMDCLDLDTAIDAIARVVRPGGALVCTITHPRHWPTYRGYRNEPWFDYDKELVIEAPFHITAERSHLSATHVHRPTDRYIASLAACGFSLSDMVEPMPQDAGVRAWSYPRYLAFRAIRGTDGI